MSPVSFSANFLNSFFKLKIREKFLLISYDVDRGGVPFELYNFVYTRDQEDGTLINWQRLKLFSWLPGLQTDKQAWRWDISSIFPSGIEQRHEQHKPSSVFLLWCCEAIDRFWKRGGAPSTDTAIAPLPSSNRVFRIQLVSSPFWQILTPSLFKSPKFILVNI